MRERIIDDGGKHCKKEEGRDALSSRPLDLLPVPFIYQKNLRTESHSSMREKRRKEEEG